MVEDKYIGLTLALSGTFLIGSSFIITKKGLNDAAKRTSYPHSHQRSNGPKGACELVAVTLCVAHSHSAEDLAYLRNPIWWAGMITMVVGELANFAAYTFAPAILVTPLGAMSVIIGAILASFILDEKLGRLGVCGCACCIIGSVVIVLHAPSDPEVETVDEILAYASQTSFLLYITFVTIFSTYMIFKVAPIHGTKNPMVYLSICSLVGSVSIMAIKGLGVALKLTFAGNNQLTHMSTYVFGVVVVGSILVQMNYFNKALDTFSTNVVNPIYYVFFTTATIVASAIMFSGFNTSGGVNTVSLICGFLIIFMGVYLLNLSREPEAPHHSSLETGFMNPRMSMSGRLSMESNGHNNWNYASVPNNYAPGGVLQSPTHGRRSNIYRAQNATLFSAFEEDGVALSDLPEEDESGDEERTIGRNSASVGRDGSSRSLVGSRPSGNGGVAGGTTNGRTREGEVGGGTHASYGIENR
ncbi:magnesium transporter NIPA-domain-containing protein [Kockovaella imperatae]|uniref:Magnesium transporter NIPA-domain-containing protein n=1 Tax=Kockovaella imperatae TaxID=4999 RepID=A0A1Y1U8X4_9TREE|nr:magnesium transporter NIPA-domain-containing protein [Kockovaella imperatae]ORX33947.1 magnesium transporter NIPA-domain-containing protein [Kockovaella imperatae]